MKRNVRILPGVNIQWPWSNLLIIGRKTVETRRYPLPAKYVGKELAVIETPGPRGHREAEIKKARIIGTIVFGESFEYDSKRAWQADRHRHLVEDNDPVFKFKQGVPKWGWPVMKVVQFEATHDAPRKRGIIFATACEIPSQR